MTIAESVSRIAKALANSISSSETPLLERLSQEQGLVHPDFSGAEPRRADWRPSTVVGGWNGAGDVPDTDSAEMPTAPSQLKNHEEARENYLYEISGCNESGDGDE